ncbi:MAG TPA: NAD(P)-dependent oxidoreductase, partial [Nocardioides bacterium]|nr:NAD(P)-dependent oxidoreductase [Nocardioides sp.]
MGLGAIGRPMALRLASDPAFDLVVYDVAPEPVAELVAAGARAADTVADCVVQTDVVCVMVRDDDQVRAIAAEIVACRWMSVVVVHSTIAPWTAVDLERMGLLVLDAPVSGGPMGAANGSLAIMVGGDTVAYATAEPVLERLGSTVVHAGELGAGTRMKLARNLIHFVSFTAVTEAQRLA